MEGLVESGDGASVSAGTRMHGGDQLGGCSPPPPGVQQEGREGWEGGYLFRIFSAPFFALAALSATKSSLCLERNRAESPSFSTFGKEASMVSNVESAAMYAALFFFCLSGCCSSLADESF